MMKMINELTSPPLPIVKLKQVKKSKVKTSLLSGLTLYNKFFVKLQGNYYIPLYTLPYYTKLFNGDWHEWGRIKKYILQRYRSYTKTNLSDQIEKIIFPNQKYTTTDVIILTKLTLGVGDEDKLLSQLRPFGFDQYIKQKYDNYEWVAKSYLDFSEPIEVRTGTFKPKRISQLILRTGKNMTLSVFDAFNNLFSNKVALHFDSSTLLLKYFVSLINDRMEVITPSGKYWVFKRTPKCTYPIIDYDEVDWDKLIQNHIEHGNTGITKKLEIATTAYSMLDESLYILTYYANKKIYPKMSIVDVDVMVCNNKWNDYIDTFIIKIPREMIIEKQIKYKFSNAYMTEVVWTLKNGLLGDVSFKIGHVEELEDYLISKKLFDDVNS